MNYYRLRVSENDSIQLAGADPLFALMKSGRQFKWPAHVQVVEDAKGVAYDWVPGWSWCPFVTSNVRNNLEVLLGEGVQWHGPFVFHKNTYHLLNCTTIVDCALRASNCNQMRLDHSKLGGVHMFRPNRFRKHLFVSEALRDAIVTNGDTGVRFGLLKPDGWEEFPF
jgi:hypothetical protein